MSEENKIGNIESLENNEKVAIKSASSPFAATFYFEDYLDEKEMKKFLENTKRLIRNSKEYENYIEMLRLNYTVLNKDSILSNMTSSDAPLEFHHYPFSLYDICEIVLLDFLSKKENVNSFILAQKVMELHSKHLIGLVSLLETTHDLAHSGNIFLNKNQIFGDYQGFMNMFSNTIPQPLKDRVAQMELLSEHVPSDFKGIL